MKILKNGDKVKLERINYIKDGYLRNGLSRISKSDRKNVVKDSLNNYYLMIKVN